MTVTSPGWSSSQMRYFDLTWHCLRNQGDLTYIIWGLWFQWAQNQTLNMDPLSFHLSKIRECCQKIPPFWRQLSSPGAILIVVRHRTLPNTSYPLLQNQWHCPGRRERGKLELFSFPATRWYMCTLPLVQINNSVLSEGMRNQGFLANWEILLANLVLLQKRAKYS